ncbi:MAG: DUF58 domain-containing protein, partial [Anaerolineae bacterium]|nr:DUF58 domain-containing protein [Anaerolineae bacterium]
MGRRRGLSALTFITILTSMAALNGVMLALAIPLLVFILAGLFYGPRPPEIDIDRQLERDRTAIDDPVTLEIEVRNNGAGVEELHLSNLIDPKLELIEGDAHRVIKLGAGKTRRFSLTLSGRRGEYIFPDVNIATQDHFSLWRRTASVEAPARLVVLPRAEPLRRVAIRPVRTHGYSGQIPARLGGAGVNFFGLRTYEPGDPMHWINWRTSARYENQLFTKLFEQERVADVNLIVDGRERS